MKNDAPSITPTPLPAIMRTTVSLDGGLFRVAKEYADSLRPRLNFTECVELALTQMLRREGRLIEGPAVEVEQMARELIKTQGAEAVRAKLEELAQGPIAAAGAA